MKQIIKSPISPITKTPYVYPADREKILSELEIEQEFFCAYTEDNLSPGYSRDVEHFDPSLKGTPKDDYANWFAVSSRLNRKKGSKPRWLKHQPILHPTSSDLQKRLLYSNGYYIVANIKDKEAKNLKDFLFLNQLGFPEARKSYINSLKTILDAFGNNISDLEKFLRTNPSQIRFRTAIKTEFGITL